MSRIVIAPHAGGLGDSLLYSTLPECYARRGDEVWVSTHTPFRNPETCDLVWGHNPFVRGFLPQSGSVGGNHLTPYVHAAKSDSPIARMERAHGFRGVHTVPKIYYRPKFVPEFRSAVLCDPTSISQGFSKDVFEHFVSYHAKNRGFAFEDVTVVGSNYSGHSGRDSLPANPHVMVKDIYELCDLIFSCRLFLGVESGAISLASAIKGLDCTPDIICLMTAASYNDRIFTHPNVHYSVTGSLTGDYKEW